MLAVLVVFAVSLALYLGWRLSAQPPEASAHRARVAFINSDFAQAREIASRVPEGDEDWSEAQLIAGEASTRLDDYDEAIGYYSKIERNGRENSLKASLAVGEIYRIQGAFTQAENEYQYVLEHDPQNAVVRERRAYQLALTRQLWEARPHFLFLAQHGRWTLDSLAILGDLERPIEQSEYLDRCARHAPGDPLVQLALAANALYVHGKSEKAREHLEEVLDRRTDIPAAHAMLGEILLNDDESAFLNWHADLPSEANDHPDIWYVRGLWARRHHKLPFAARCFWAAIGQVPVHKRANYQLGQVLSLLKDPSAGDFEQLAARQFDLTRYLDQVLRAKGRNEKALRQIVDVMEETGRFWEACAWAETAGRYYPEASWAKSAYRRLRPRLQDDSPQVLREHHLALKHDLSKYPATDEDLLHHGGPAQPSSSDGVPSTIRFDLADAGVDFEYENGDDPSTAGTRMFEQTGGGIAVIDLDFDHWPDLYFPQGAEWPTGAVRPAPSPKLADQVFRNIEGKRFINVTAKTGLVNLDFAQGASVGDVDGDGFPDLYIANIGQNALFLNNGDGTFRNATESAGLAHSDWTTSTVIVDLNQDGLADLFDVTYVTGPKVYTLICQGKGCSPNVFTGVPDRLLINRGDGSFESVPVPASVENSKGLGVIAFDLEQRGRPSLFIANDQVANFLLQNFPSDDPFNIRLAEQALVRGVGFNMDGLAMACMGIAADDADGDGRLDFFVTNFQDESNTLYLQDVEGLFNDATLLAGLTAPSVPYVGWGTQFLDADLDGAPDLVLVNGHVDDYRDQGKGYRMKPQFFWNKGKAQFLEVPSAQLGSFFESEHLGRGLAKFDWNRDGRMDFVVSNINEPASILTNKTTAGGHFVSIRLRATTTARDAIGSVVVVESQSGKWTKQLVAGDGFQASNERMLHFGLGPGETVASLQVTWPSGRTTKLQNLPADGTLDLVEGMVATYTQRGRAESLAFEHFVPPELSRR